MAKGCDDHSDACWICASVKDPVGSPLVHQCKCNKVSHPRCLSMWQVFKTTDLQPASTCADCKEELPEWSEGLRPHVSPDQIDILLAKSAAKNSKLTRTASGGRRGGVRFANPLDLRMGGQGSRDQQGQPLEADPVAANVPGTRAWFKERGSDAFAAFCDLLMIL